MKQTNSNAGAAGSDCLPADKMNLEGGLPDWLQEAVDARQAAWEKLDAGKGSLPLGRRLLLFAERHQCSRSRKIISFEQAWYLRKKHLQYGAGDI